MGRDRPRRGAPAVWGRLGRGLLAAQLLLSPLVFSSRTLDSFEAVKLVLLAWIALLLAALGWARLGARDLPRGPLRVFREPVAVGLGLFCLSALVSAAGSISPRTSLFGAEDSFLGLATMLSCGIVFAATRLLVRDAGAAERLLRAPLIASGLAAVYALVQAAGLDPYLWTGAAIAPGTTVLRPFGPLGHPNLLAGYLVMTLPLALHFAGTAAARGQRWTAAVSLAVAAAAGAAILASHSRAAWLALASALLCFCSSGAGRRARAGRAALILGGAAALLALLLFATPGGATLIEGLGHRMAQLTQPGGRPAIWAAALGMLARNPVLGCGTDAFGLAFASVRPPGYALVEWNVTPTRAHNELLHALATQGGLGGVAAALLGAALARAAIRALWGSTQHPLLGAVAAGSAGFAVVSTFGFSAIPGYALMATFAALLGGAPAAAERLGAERPGVSRRLAVPLGLVLVACGSWQIARRVEADVSGRAGRDRLAADPAGAVARLEHAVALDAGRSLLWSLLGRAHQQAAVTTPEPELRRRHLAEAQRAFETAAGLVPADSAHGGRLCGLFAALALEGMATPAEARARCDAALALDPVNVPLQVLAGQSALALRETAAAAAHARRALELYPRLGPALHILGRAALVEERSDDALELLEAALAAEWHGDRDRWGTAAADLAWLLARLGRPADGERTARAALLQGSTAIELRFALGACLEGQGRTREALAEYEAVLMERPGHPPSRRAIDRLRAPRPGA